MNAQLHVLDNKKIQLLDNCLLCHRNTHEWFVSLQNIVSMLKLDDKDLFPYDELCDIRLLQDFFIKLYLLEQGKGSALMSNKEPIPNKACSMWEELEHTIEPETIASISGEIIDLLSFVAQDRPGTEIGSALYLVRLLQQTALKSLGFTA